MKLARLLAAGKSFVAARDGANRYRLNRVALPKFLSPRNPFAPPERAEPRPAGSPSLAPTAAPERADERCPAQGVARWKRPWPRMIERVKQWARGLGCRVIERRAPGASGRGNGAVTPVQREFSLDHIRVVRNDLREDDIEVVVTGPAKVAARNDAASPRWGVVGRAWERLSNRFSTVNQS